MKQGPHPKRWILMVFVFMPLGRREGGLCISLNLKLLSIGVLVCECCHPRSYCHTWASSMIVVMLELGNNGRHIIFETVF